jgi:hypothetical protein
MVKKLILPIQMWLLGRGQCVGCGRQLKEGVVAENAAGQVKVTCRC